MRKMDIRSGFYLYISFKGKFLYLYGWNCLKGQFSTVQVAIKWVQDEYEDIFTRDVLACLGMLFPGSRFYAPHQL